MENKNENNNFWFGFLLGLLFGSAVLFFLGTKKGKKFIGKILEKTENLEENLGKKKADKKTSEEDLLKSAEKIKKKVAEMAKDKKLKTPSSILDKVDSALNKLESVQKKGAKLTGDVRSKYFKKDGKPLKPQNTDK